MSKIAQLRMGSRNRLLRAEMARQKDTARNRPTGQTPIAIENNKSMRPVQERYRNFCEHIAAICEAEAKAYEEHPRLHDGDFQFISSLRDKCDEWRQQLRRMEGRTS